MSSKGSLRNGWIAVVIASASDTATSVASIFHEESE